MRDELIAPGHRTCAGCGSILAARMLLRATGRDVIICEPTGCIEVTTTQFPLTSWKVPWIHVTFENAASVAAGVKAALEAQGNDHTQVIAFGGDGGMVDIGFGAVSGAFERNDDIMIVTYDNEAYSNTGVQRSGATPYGASTTTSPAGLFSIGKTQWKKNMLMIAMAHGCKYVASASIAFPKDLEEKVKKAMKIKGARYIHIHTPCPVGWGFDSSKTIEVARLAVQTGMWILYEIDEGKLKITYKPTELKPVKEYLTMQKRFKHLKDEDIEFIQKRIKENWEELLKLEKSDIDLRKIV